MNKGPIFLYDYTITCKTCGKKNDYTCFSVNPHKKALTFKERNPYTGFGGMNSMQKLTCGHMQDCEGVPVKTHKETGR